MNKLSKKALEYKETKNERLFNEIYNEITPKIYYFILKKVKNKNDAFNVVMNTMVKFYEKIDDYNPQFELSTWLFTIAKKELKDILIQHNNILDSNNLKNELLINGHYEELDKQIKRNIDNPIFFYDKESGIYERKKEFKDFSDKVLNEINNFNYPHNYMMYDYAVNGLKYGSIAIKYNVSLQVVKNNIKRTREYLKRKIRNRNEYYSLDL